MSSQSTPLHVALTMRDALARSHDVLLFGYQNAHKIAQCRAQSEFNIDGPLADALRCHRESTLAFLNLSCPSCERFASFDAHGTKLTLVENTIVTPDEVLLTQASDFMSLVFDGHFGDVLPV